MFWHTQLDTFSQAPLEAVKVKHTKLQCVWASLNVHVCKKHHVLNAQIGNLSKAPPLGSCENEAL